MNNFWKITGLSILSYFIFKPKKKNAEITLNGVSYVIEDNRPNARKPLNELSFFKRKDYNVLLKNSNILTDTGKLKIIDIPLTDININTTLFQNRKEHYSKESVNRIINAVENNTFNWELFDPILLYKDKDGKLFILSGHSRTEAFKRLCNAGNKDFCKIPAKIITNISESQAVEIALKSNTLSTKEKESERAEYYRKQLFVLNRPFKEVQEEARQQEGKNYLFILRLAFLYKNGLALRDFEKTETLKEEDRKIIRLLVDWLGALKMRFISYPLTEMQENEIYLYFLKRATDKRLWTKTSEVWDWFTEILKRNNDILPERLNLKDEKTSFKMDYDNKLKEIESNLNKAKTALENKRKELIKKQVDELQIKNIIEPYNLEVNHWLNALLRHKNDFTKYLEAEKQQTNLFGLKKYRYE